MEVAHFTKGVPRQELYADSLVEELRPLQAQRPREKHRRGIQLPGPKVLVQTSARGPGLDLSAVIFHSEVQVPRLHDTRDGCTSA